MCLTPFSGNAFRMGVVTPSGLADINGNSRRRGQRGHVTVKIASNQGSRNLAFCPATGQRNVVRPVNLYGYGFDSEVG
jgi:hypothetical protein